MIDLKETEREFLLFIPAPEKDRARAIAGYRWNPNRRCWVYPKTPRVYDALLQEFGPELPTTVLPRPTTPVDDAAAAEDYCRLAAEYEALRRELALQERRLNRGGGAGEPARHERQPSATLLERRIAERDAQIAALSERLEEAEARARRFADAAAATRGGHGADGAGHGSSGGDHQQFIAFFRALALEAAGRDGDFRKLAGALASPPTFPSAAARALAERLAARLGAPSSRLADMVEYAETRSALSSQGAELARMVAHLGDHGADGPPGAVWARCLLALYAAALVWTDVADRSS